MVLWLAGRAAAHQWSGCAHGTWEQWPCGEERAGKELAQQTAPHQETPARGPRPHTPCASGVCVPDGDGVCRGSGWSGQVGPHNAPVVHSRWAVWGGAV